MSYVHSQNGTIKTGIKSDSFDLSWKTPHCSQPLDHIPEACLFVCFSCTVIRKWHNYTRSINTYTCADKQYDEWCIKYAVVNLSFKLCCDLYLFVKQNKYSCDTISISCSTSVPSTISQLSRKLMQVIAHHTSLVEIIVIILDALRLSNYSENKHYQSI